jgi:hypothetical protein
MNHTIIGFPPFKCACPDCNQPAPFVSDSIEITIKLTADEYARLVAAWSGSGMQDTKTGFVKRAVMSAVELLEGD